MLLLVFLPMILILSVGLLAMLAAASLFRFPKTKPFAPWLVILAWMGTCWALAITGMVLDASRAMRWAPFVLLTLPLTWFAGLNLAKAWRALAAGASPATTRN
jgi:hypothetical protein